MIVILHWTAVALSATAVATSLWMFLDLNDIPFRFRKLIRRIAAK